MLPNLIWRKDGPLNGMTGATLQAVDALVAQAYAEPARVGLYGVSQGGFSSLWVTTQTDRFKATVSLNGWSDMYTHIFEVNYGTRLYSARAALHRQYGALYGDGRFGTLRSAGRRTRIPTPMCATVRCSTPTR